MKSRVPVLVVVCFLLVSLQLSAAEYRPFRGSVLVMVKSSSGTEDQEFRSLMLSVIRVEVEDRELEMVELGSPPPEGEQPLDSAKKAGAEFGLAVAYTMGGQDVSYDLDWYDVAARKKAASASRKSALDFTLDVSIASAVVEILDGQKDRISALPLKPDPNAVQEAATPPVEAAPVELGKDVVRLEKVKPFLLSVGVEPLISTFSATEYIQDLFWGAKASVAWRFALLGGVGGLGIMSGYQRYDVVNVSYPGPFSGIPVGAQVHYGTRMPGPLDFFTHFEGGVLIWTWDQTSSGGNLLNGVVWFIAGGVGLVVDILKNFGIAIDVTYSYYPLNPAFTFLEPSLVLMLKL
jgi:hypothetical protein